MARPFGDLPTRFDPPGGPTGRVAVVAAGRAYSPASPAAAVASVEVHVTVSRAVDGFLAALDR